MIFGLLETRQMLSTATLVAPYPTEPFVGPVMNAPQADVAITVAMISNRVVSPTLMPNGPDAFGPEPTDGSTPPGSEDPGPAPVDPGPVVPNPSPDPGNPIVSTVVKADVVVLDTTNPASATSDINWKLTISKTEEVYIDGNFKISGSVISAGVKAGTKTSTTITTEYSGVLKPGQSMKLYAHYEFHREKIPGWLLGIFTSKEVWVGSLTGIDPWSQFPDGKAPTKK